MRTTEIELLLHADVNVAGPEAAPADAGTLARRSWTRPPAARALVFSPAVLLLLLRRWTRPSPRQSAKWYGFIKEVAVTRRTQHVQVGLPPHTYKILPGTIGDADLRPLTVPEVDAMLDALKNTQAIVFSIRGYRGSSSESPRER